MFVSKSNNPKRGIFIYCLHGELDGKMTLNIDIFLKWAFHIVTVKTDFLFFISYSRIPKWIRLKRLGGGGVKPKQKVPPYPPPAKPNPDVAFLNMKFHVEISKRFQSANFKRIFFFYPKLFLFLLYPQILYGTNSTFFIYFVFLLEFGITV